MDNWLINLLALVLFAVVLDGARRAWLKHRDSMKVSRNLSRSMRRGLDDDNNEILSTPRVVELAARPSRHIKDDYSPAAREAAGEVSRDFSRAPSDELTRESIDGSTHDSSFAWNREHEPDCEDAEAESPLEYIDPEEAEKRRQIAAELPGTARVVQRRKPEDASQVNRQVQQNYHTSRKPLAGSRPDRREGDELEEVSPVRSQSRQPARTPEQTSLNLDDQVPTLMDSVADEEPGYTDESPCEEGQPHCWPATTDHVDDADPEYDPETEIAARGDIDPLAALAERPVSGGRREPSLDESASLDSLNADVEEPVTDDYFPEEKPRSAKSLWAGADLKLPEIRFPDLKKAIAPTREPRGKPLEKTELPAKKQSGKREAAPRKERAVEEVLILNIMAPTGDYFEGNDLLRAVFACDMRFGDMNIFHFHTGEDGEGPALFSLANMVVPGTFDMSEMEDFITPGVSLFLALPAEVEALKAFNTLLTTARYIAEQLGGELKDENRSVFTAQTAEHYRQRVMEFQRRKALAKAQA